MLYGIQLSLPAPPRGAVAVVPVFHHVSSVAQGAAPEPGLWPGTIVGFFTLIWRVGGCVGEPGKLRGPPLACLLRGAGFP